MAASREQRNCAKCNVRYQGTVMPEEVGAVFAAYDFFLFRRLAKLRTFHSGVPRAERP